MDVSPACPRCHATPMKRLELPDWALLHWVLNPGIAVNELLLGQRVPRLTLICTRCPEPLLQRQYIPCPHCASVHNAMAWRGRQFGNWLGLPCPSCGGRIPCLRNLAALVLLGLLAPLWYLPYRFHFRDRPARPFVPAEPKIRRYWAVRAGALWGGFMFLLALAPQVSGYLHTGRFSLLRLLAGLGICGVGGVLFGLMMHLVLGRRGARGS